MILGLLRVLAIGLILMTMIYLLVSAFLRGSLAAGYRKQWAELPAGERLRIAREDWVRRKVEAHRSGIRLRAFLMSFALMPAGFMATIILVN
ncbi:hypothetical protein [Paracoccus sp. ME4]|uniref:hypothetical protein n=1 Tax=Paracoccus sp. ME4 TaxID=3138066 RepID=UPI00398B163F